MHSRENERQFAISERSRALRGTPRLAFIAIGVLAALPTRATEMAAWQTLHRTAKTNA
jgi:hypothetical protein